MKPILTLFAVLLLGLTIEAQQTISSKGNGNLNTNNNTTRITITPTVVQPIKTIIIEHVKTARGTEEGWEGTLLPAKDPIDFGACAPERDYLKSLGKNQLAIHLGTDLIVCRSSACNVIRMGSNELIWLVSEHGVLTVNAMVRLDDGTILTSIENGKFYVNRNQTYRPPARPDPSTLVVYDQKGTEMLRVRFENAQSVRVSGHFRDGAGAKIDITSAGLTLASDSPAQISGACFIDPENAANRGPATQLGRFAIGGSPVLP